MAKKVRTNVLSPLQGGRGLGKWLKSARFARYLASSGDFFGSAASVNSTPVTKTPVSDSRSPLWPVLSERLPGHAC